VVNRFHFGSGDVVGEGTFRVWRSRTRRGRLLGALLRLPRPSDATRVTLSIRRPPVEAHAEPVEYWSRRFGADRMDTLQTSEGESLVERVGRTELRFNIAVVDDGLCFVHTGTRVRLGPWSVRVPRRLAPRIEASVGASPDQLRLRVWVQISAMGVGPVLSYAGHLSQVGPS
jgi:hypothetical protein